METFLKIFILILFFLYFVGNCSELIEAATGFFGDWMDYRRSQGI